MTPAWDDVCWEMVMRCEQTDDGFVAPPISLVAEFCQRYPMWSDDFVDFAATCRTVDFWASKYPAPEPTKDEINRSLGRTMKLFRAARRKKARNDNKKNST